MVPKYLYKHLRGATEWKWIVEIIEGGGHPFKLALSQAFRGDDPIPEIVRQYLADRFEIGWPKGGRRKTPWEKYIRVGTKFADGEDPLQLFEAALEFEHEWVSRKFCYYIVQGLSNDEAIKLTLQNA